MKRWLLGSLLVLFAAASLAVLASCAEHNGPAERAGRSVDKAANKTAKAVGNAMKKTGEALEKAGEKVKKKVDEKSGGG